MASFYVIRGTDSGQHFPIRGALATIGRDAGNQIRLRDTEVSRSHAKIVRNAEAEHEIFDNGSSNGTFVNSRKVQSKLLQSGDRVQVGRTLMIYTGGPEPHASRDQQEVEIVTRHQASELSQIRSSLDSAPPTSQPELADDSRAKFHPSTLPSPTKKSLPTLSSALEPAATVESPVNDPAPLPAKRPQAAHDVEREAGNWETGSWEIVYQVNQAIRRTGDLDELLHQVLDLIFHWIECDRGCLLLLDDVTGQLTPTHNRARLRESGAGRPSRPRKMTISRTILEHVVSSKEGVLTSNAQDDARWEGVESIASLGVCEAICVPMLGRYGLVGAIYVDTEVSAGVYAQRRGKSHFDEQHLKLMVAIGGQAALAIEDTQFYHAMLQAERLAAMGQTIANLSHHVKNILQGVRGGSFLVEDGLKKADLPVIEKGWGIVRRNQERISNLVMDMLSFSKDREPHFERQDIRKVISEVVELMQARAADHQVQLTWQSPPEPVEVDCDEEAMHRAVLNVVTNAIDAVSQFERMENSEAGNVRISCELLVAKNQVRIHVCDNGAGISEAEITRIFAPFESNKGARGTGLGLPVSQKILREHGGDISVVSQTNHSTTFTLYWPARQKPPLESTTPDPRDPEPNSWDSRATVSRKG